MISLLALTLWIQNPPTPTPPAPPPTIPGVTVTMTLDKAEATLGDVLQAEVHVKNTSDKPVTVPSLTFDERSCFFEVDIDNIGGGRKVFDYAILGGHPLTALRIGVPQVTLEAGKEMVGFFQIPTLTAGKMSVTAKYKCGEQVTASEKAELNVKEKDGKTRLMATFDVTVPDQTQGQVKVTMKVRLYPDISPRNVANFVTLARGKFYDGLQFFSIVRSKWAQSGCPFDRGSGNPGYAVRAEKTPNAPGSPKHDEGTLALGGFVDRDEYTSSQFFFTFGKIPSFDGKYTIIGKIESAPGDKSLDALQKINSAGVDGTTVKPSKPIVITGVTITVE